MREAEGGGTAASHCGDTRDVTLCKNELETHISKTGLGRVLWDAPLLQLLLPGSRFLRSSLPQ